MNVGNSDARHAAVVDWTFAQKTGTARNSPLHERSARREGRGAIRGGGTHHPNDGDTDSAGYVHRAGIISDEKLAA
jgi:hypothetical protein